MPMPNTAAVTECRPLSAPELCLCTDILIMLNSRSPNRWFKLRLNFQTRSALLQRARHSCNPNLGGSGFTQNAGALGCSCAGGQNIVNQQDLASRHSVRCTARN